MDYDPNPEINHDNKGKHGISLIEAQDVFLDPYLKSDEYDINHSDGEDRYHALGMLPNGKTIIATYTIRDSKYRLITAREATREEKREYASHIKKLLGLL